MRLIIGRTILVSLVLGSCRPQEQTTSADFYLNWIYSGSFAGEVVAAELFAKDLGLKIQLRQGGQGLDPLKLVSEGSFGIAAADEILRAVEKGADFVIIGVVNDDSPAAFVSLAGSGIDSPTAFAGKRVGILPFGSTGLVYQALLRRSGVDRSQITEVVVSPDLRTFIAGATHDVQPVFAYDEPTTLEAQGIIYNLIDPRKYGVAFKGPCYFTTRSTIGKYSAIVQAFVSAMVSGWQFALANPDSAIGVLKLVDPTVDRVRELTVLRRGSSYFADSTRRPLEAGPSGWRPMIEDLISSGVLSGAVDTVRSIDLSFVRRAYSQDR